MENESSVTTTRFIRIESILRRLSSDEYEWKHDGCFLPPDEELVIYEIHVGDFTGGETPETPRGTFKNIKEKIEYLKQLGVNASELSLHRTNKQSIDLLPL